MARNINPTEALYGFFGWIVSGGKRHTLGGGYHGGVLHSKLARFCEVNNLPYLEDDWEKNVILPQSFGTARVTRKQRRRGYRNNAETTL